MFRHFIFVHGFGFMNRPAEVHDSRQSPPQELRLSQPQTPEKVSPSVAIPKSPISPSMDHTRNNSGHSSNLNDKWKEGCPWLENSTEYSSDGLSYGVIMFCSLCNHFNVICGACVF
jgi:hypothetical protein